MERYGMSSQSVMWARRSIVPRPTETGKHAMSGIRSIAGFAAIAGIVSSALSIIDYNLKILFWIDMWGELMGWGIRAALVVVGGALFFLLPSGEAAHAAQAPPTASSE
jgi:hypothetical protein